MTCLRPLKEQREELRGESRDPDFSDPSILMCCSLRWQACNNEPVTTEHDVS